MHTCIRLNEYYTQTLSDSQSDQYLVRKGTLSVTYVTGDRVTFVSNPYLMQATFYVKSRSFLTGATHRDSHIRNLSSAC